MRHCYLIQPDVVVLYIYPVFGGKFDTYAHRFSKTYVENAPKIAHRLIVISNGGEPRPEMRAAMAPTGCEWLTHDNSGYDIGAFQMAARKIPAQLMVFFGNSAYLRKQGWLERMIQSSEKHGNKALYGSMGHRGDIGHNVYPHIRTTGWWINPALLNAYPFHVLKPEVRYEFEHGKTCLSEWIRTNGLQRLVVTFNAEYEWKDWDLTGNGYHQGDQSGLLSGDRLTEPPYYPTP